jgi:hypothetical protein
MGAYDRLTLGQDSSGRPLVINRRTAAMLRDAERRLGEDFTIVQGSFMKNGADASALTHAGGGVVDLRVWDLDATPWEAVKALRLAGFAAWHRKSPTFKDPHIHAVAMGDKTLHPQAADQVRDYRNGRNGLADNGPDDGPKVRRWVWERVKRYVAVQMAQRELDRWIRDHRG